MQRIYHDLFHIAERLLQIDPCYQVFWNGERERYEVFWHGKLAFIVPFDALDVRTLTYAQRTRRENADDIEREIDESNAASRTGQKNSSFKSANKGLCKI